MKHIKYLAFALTMGLFIGLWMQHMEGGQSIYGLLSTVGLVTSGVYLLVLLWDWAGRRQVLAWMLALAVFTRLIFGLGVSLALPIYGYPEPCQKAGYLFKDACHRDQEAYSLARSGALLLPSSRVELDNDQYGGLAFLSVWMYRYLSPDAHRPFLVLIAGVFFLALGLPFFFMGAERQWSPRIALIAGWIYALYPDSIFFSASQMREPFVIGLSGVALWAAWTWRTGWRRRLVVLVSSLLVMAFFSSRVAMMETGFIAVWIWLEVFIDEWHTRYRWLGWAGLATGALFIVLMTWGWFHSSTSWDVIVTVRDSGWMQKIIKEVGEERTVPIVSFYGLVQPVLPAAIADNAIPLWKSIVIVRSVGWYLIAPFLVYGCLALWKIPDSRQRKMMIWLALLVAAWTLIASLRGGGDATDNPRYRTLMIPWLALLAGWAADWAWTWRSILMGRILIIEGVFFAYFMSWYSARYFHIGVKLPFWQMVTIIVGMSTLLLASAFIRMPAKRFAFRAGKSAWVKKEL